MSIEMNIEDAFEAAHELFTRILDRVAGVKETLRLLVRYTVKVGRRVRTLEAEAANNRSAMELVTTVLEQQAAEIAELRANAVFNHPSQWAPAVDGWATGTKSSPWVSGCHRPEKTEEDPA